MLPIRLNLITYNIWNTERWDVRERAFRKFFELFTPDVLCVQELRHATQRVLNDILPDHARVRDGFIGWTSESNIWWRDDAFAELEHGAEEIGHKEKDRRLFWVRLELRELGRSLLIATAHFTHQRHAQESASGQSPRIEQTRRAIAALARLNRPHEPLFLLGDLNDPVHAPYMLHDAGYVSCFAALGLQTPPTFKAYPTAHVKPGGPTINQAIDWIVANGHARAIAASVPQLYVDDASPSDHWPVQAIYEIQG